MSALAGLELGEVSLRGNLCSARSDTRVLTSVLTRQLDLTSDAIELAGLEEELKQYENHEVRAKLSAYACLLRDTLGLADACHARPAGGSRHSA